MTKLKKLNNDQKNYNLRIFKTIRKANYKRK